MLGFDRRKRARFQLLEKIVDSNSQNEGSRKAPCGFVCPLTLEVMFDPVLDAEGNTYERSALLQWLQHNATSPVSRQPLNEHMIVSNNALRETIHEFMGTTWVQSNTADQEDAPPRSGLAPSRLRSKIDCFLQNTCKELGGLDLKLNSDGCCAFRYDNITIVLDVPDQVGIFCLYTKGLLQDVSFDQDEVYKRAMELNFLQGEVEIQLLQGIVTVLWYNRKLTHIYRIFVTQEIPVADACPLAITLVEKKSCLVTQTVSSRCRRATSPTFS